MKYAELRLRCRPGGSIFRATLGLIQAYCVDIFAGAQTDLNDATSGAWLPPTGYVAEYLTAPGAQSQVFLGQTINSNAPGYVPAPSSISLFGLGLAGLWTLSRRRPA